MNPVSVETNEISVPAENLNYEAPRVESVLTSEEMEREISYAGSNGTAVTN